MKLNRKPFAPPKLSPLKIPDGLIILQDNREQRPLFRSERAVRDNLPYTSVGGDDILVIDESGPDGDYTIKGFEHLFAVERKQMSDLCSYIGVERSDKTEPKMERFRDIVRDGGFAALVVEASHEDISLGYHHSRVHPNSLMGSLSSFAVRYGVHCYYQRDRELMARQVLDWMIKFYKMQREV